ncbi:anthranilate synthase component I family protein, partial [Micromonospora sp. NPDC002296]
MDVPAAPAACRDSLTERDRLHWHRRDGGDPARLVEEFLTAHGLGVDDLSRPASHDPTGVCGAAVYVSAAAGAVMAAAPPGAASGAPRRG